MLEAVAARVQGMQTRTLVDWLGVCMCMGAVPRGAVRGLGVHFHAMLRHPRVTHTQPVVRRALRILEGPRAGDGYAVIFFN